MMVTYWRCLILFASIVVATRLRRASAHPPRVRASVLPVNGNRAMTENSNPSIKGTAATVRFSRVVDGDTIRIYTPGSTSPESIRILSLDTEESFSGFTKPVTPWGKAAKKFAQSFFANTSVVTLEFPGNAPLDIALDTYRGNFGRLLAWVHKDGVDFSEVMIRKGYSPYYNKYGNAEFSSHHQRYIRAEREAQAQRIGVWDQIAVNGAVLRDYPALTTWWTLRATIIDEYRRLRAVDSSVLNTRKDYATLKQLADKGDVATVFTEVREVSRSYGDTARADIGSRVLPFSLIIPNAEEEPGMSTMSLLRNRYISASEKEPRRSYCYATGRLHIDPRGSGTIQMVIASPVTITDTLAARNAEEVDVSFDEDETITGGAQGPEETSIAPVSTEPQGIKISSLLPDPVGEDFGRETVTLRINGSSSVDLAGWVLKDASGRSFDLDGNLNSGESRTFTLRGGSVTLNNNGDSLYLIDQSGRVIHQVSYGPEDVKAGVSIDF